MSPLQRSLYCCGGLYQRTSGPSFSELKFRDKQNCSTTAAIISGFINRRLACEIESGALCAGWWCSQTSLHLIEGKFSDCVYYRSLHAITSNRNRLPLNFVFSTSRKKPLTVQDEIYLEITIFLSFFLSVTFICYVAQTHFSPRQQSGLEL